MSLDKAIKHNKEYRKPYYGAKSVDKNCRNHGTCDWCKRNRLYSTNKRIAACNYEYEQFWDYFYNIWHYEYKYELSGYSQEFIKYHDERVNNSISNSYECIHTNSGVFVYPKYQSDDEYWNSYYANVLGVKNFKFEY